jgi:hypothetical protein
LTNAQFIDRSAYALTFNIYCTRVDCPPTSTENSKHHPEKDSFTMTATNKKEAKPHLEHFPLSSLFSPPTDKHARFFKMFRRTSHPPSSNPFTSSLSLASIHSVAGSTNLPSLPTTSTSNTSTNNTTTDEEANNADSSSTTNEKFSLFSKLKKHNNNKKSKKPKPAVPTRKAGPEEIRAFFAALLTEHDVAFADDADKCEAIVSAWKIGGGVEMRQYGPAMYLEMFGREYGWILYREVRMSIRNESNILLRRPLCTSEQTPLNHPQAHPSLTIYPVLVSQQANNAINRHLPHRLLPPTRPDHLAARARRDGGGRGSRHHPGLGRRFPDALRLVYYPLRWQLAGQDH